LAKLLLGINAEAISCVSHLALEHNYFAANHVLTKGFKKGQHTVRIGKAIDIVAHAQMVEETLLAQLTVPGLEAILSGDDVGNRIRVDPQSIV
jgi:hypothetical protein